MNDAQLTTLLQIRQRFIYGDGTVFRFKGVDVSAAVAEAITDGLAQFHAPDEPVNLTRKGAELLRGIAIPPELQRRPVGE